MSVERPVERMQWFLKKKIYKPHCSLTEPFCFVQHEIVANLRFKVLELPQTNKKEVIRSSEYAGRGCVKVDGLSCGMSIGPYIVLNVVR